MFEPGAKPVRPQQQVRGSLGIHLHRRRKDLTAQKEIPVVDRQRLELQFDGLFNVRDRFFQRAPLRLAPLQLGTPGIKTPVVLFDNHTCLASHTHQSTPTGFPFRAPAVT
jgi:hypothetical protein